MPIDDEQQTPPTTKIDALVRFIFATEEDVDALSDVQVTAFLQEEGLDPDSRLGELRQRLSSIDGAERLQKARESREAAQSQAAPNRAGMWPDIRAELQRRLSKLRFTNPEAAGMYARNFDTLSEADMLDMIDDLIELEGDDGAGDDLKRGT